MNPHLAASLTFGLFACTAVSAEEPQIIRLPASWGMLALDSAVPPPREPRPDFTREIEERKSYGIPAAEIVGFDFLLNQFDRRYFGCCDFDSNLRTIRRNLRSSWGVDRDPFTVNQLGHPYQGSMYHGFARASGLNFWEGLGYTFVGSAFWEIAGETTPPSRNDQITTGIGGAFLGEALFRMANLVLEHDNIPQWGREIVAAALSPPTGFNRAAFGDRFRSVFPSRGPIYFTRLQLGFGGSESGDKGFSAVKLKRGEALADFYIDYGLPGKKDYQYTRPFDYFSFQATASSANGFENAMVRGLLAGKEYEVGSRYRGLWGAYGSYDYIAPQTYRVASTAVSVGTTGQWNASKTSAIMGTVLFGLGYAAAGTVNSTADNDFHYGLAPQALVALRGVYRDRIAIDVSAREWYVSRVGSGSHGGSSNIARVDAAITYRVQGRHGVTLKYLGNQRNARFPGLGGTTQTRETVGLFYTLLGHDRFGAVEW